nr:hypothetical protein [Tanacetum cinerariifolium]
VKAQAPTKPHHTPFPEVESSHPTTSSIPLPSIPTAPIPTVTQLDTTPIIRYSRRARIAQSSALPTVEDEPASPVRDVGEGEACPTDSGFIADQDMATIAKTSTLPHDSAPRVTSPAADEGNMQQNISELTALCTSLQRQYSELMSKFQAQEEEIGRLKERVQVLEEREAVATKQYGEDVPIKGRNNNEGEAAAERISNDSEEIARVLTSMDAATVLAGETNVPTSSGFIPTAGPPATVISTGSEREDMRMNEQIARDVEVAMIHVEEEIQDMIDSLDKSNETIAKYLQEYQQFASELPLEKKIELISDLVKYQEHYTKVHKFQSQQRRPMTKKQKREYYMAVINSNLGWRFKDFKGPQVSESTEKANDQEAEKGVLYGCDQKQLGLEVEDFIPMGSKEESERLKRKGLNLKKEKVHSEGQRSYWQIIRLGGSSACYQFFVDLLRQLDREDLNQLWALVKEYLSIKPASSYKEMELWVELKRMYKPDPEDQLWTLTQNYMHAPVEWKLYDLSGVHHVTAKDKEIFMLVEKDYPLRRGLALVMISYRLQVENHSQMAEDLIIKIYSIANTPRKQSD